MVACATGAGWGVVLTTHASWHVRLVLYLHPKCLGMLKPLHLKWVYCELGLQVHSARPSLRQCSHADLSLQWPHSNRFHRYWN